MLRGTVHVALAAALASTLLLSSCASEPAVKQPAPVPSATTSAPVFATKEEALAAAEKVYRRYLELGEELGRHPRSADLSVLSSVLTTPQIAVESKSVADAARSGLHSDGPAVLKVFRGQSVDLGRGTIVAYACVDYSNVRVSDRTGKNVTPSGSSRYTDVVTFKSSPLLLIAAQDPYQGNPLC